MLIHPKDLINHLTEYDPKLVSNNYPDIKAFHLLNRNLKHYYSDCIYIGRLSEIGAWLPEGPLVLLLIRDCADKELSRILLKNHSVIFVSPETDCMTLYNAVMDFFQDELHISERIFEIYRIFGETGNIQNLLNYGYRLLKNPLLLTDLSLCHIAHSGPEVDDDPLWKLTIARGYVLDEHFKYLIRQEQKQDSESKFVVDTKCYRHPLLIYRIVQNEDFAGYLKMLVCTKKITDSDRRIMKALGDCLYPSLARGNTEQSTDSNRIGNFLASLIGKRILAPSAIDEHRKMFNFTFNSNMLLIVIELSRFLMQNTGRADIFKRQLQNLFASATVFFFEDHLVIFYHYPISGNPPKRKEDLRELLKRNQCRAGISPEFYDLYRLPSYYDSACSAIDTARQMKITDMVVNYEDLKFQHAVLTLAKSIDLNLFIHPALTLMRKDFGKKFPMYYETIKVFVQNKLDITATAKALSLHYNTIKYRLKRIAEYTDLNFTDSHTLFHLQVSFFIIETLKLSLEK